MKHKKKDIACSEFEVEYKDLAPIDDAKGCAEQINALQWAINRRNVKNIALTGPYGSGKSSIINTFLNLNPASAEKSIRISLASFKGALTESASKQTGNTSPKLLSGGCADNELLAEEILKQLFYKVEQKEIPQSRYRKPHKVCYGSILLSLMLWIAVCLVFFFVFWPESITDCYEAVIAAGEKCKMAPWLSSSLFIGMLCGILVIMAKVIQLFACRMSIKEIKVPGAGTLKEKECSQNSVFNKNMDEIVYFFEETKYTLVFIEDLDRFNNTTIFAQLRDLNILLNNYDAIHRKIVFVYAIRDNMFCDTERTKFFDFIIPVIPVINSTNSGEILLKMLQTEDASGFKHDITQEYILDVAPYISDMRVLQNIYNEFLIYKATLKVQQGLTLNDQLMMSLIVFKNLFPSHFADLQEEKGIVKRAFEDKEAFLEHEREELANEIECRKNVLENIEADALKDEQEVKVAMLYAMTKGQGIATQLKFNYTEYYGDSIIQNSFDMSELLKSGTWSITFVPFRGGSRTMSHSDVSKIACEYMERLEYLQHAEAEKQARLQNEIETLKNDSRKLPSLSLKLLCEKYGASKIFSDDIRCNELLVFMLRRGYIDEKYTDYINFFKGNSITTADMNYILSVKNQTPKLFTYTLTKCDQIISRLQPHEFSERAVLNFNLLEHMLEERKYDDKLYILIEQLSNESRDSWQFIDEFVDITEHLRDFVQILSSKWARFWDDIYHNTVLTYERKLFYLSMMCRFCDLEALAVLNSAGLLAAFYVEHEDILQKLSPDLAERNVHIIATLKISFRKINIDNVPVVLLDYIFDNNCYELNADMISRVVAYKNASLCDGLDTKNYTTITTLGYLPLIDYVHDNLDEYIRKIFMKSKNTQESSSATACLLAHCFEDLPLCEEIITHQECVLESFDAICYDQIEEKQEAVRAVWNLLLSQNKIQLSWTNIFSYWEEFSLTSAVLEFVSNHADVLAEKDHNILDDSFKIAFILSDIDAKTFEKLIDCLRMDDYNIALTDISDDKLRIMIKDHFFAFSEETYQELEDCSPDLCAEFILQNQDVFEECIDSVELTSPIFEELVLDERLLLPLKEQLLNKYGSKMMTESIARNLYAQHTKIKRNVFVSAWEKLGDISSKEKLLFMYMDLLEEGSDFERCFMDMGEPYNKLIRGKTRHEELLLDTPDNCALAQKLERIGYITSAPHEERLQAIGTAVKKVPVIRFRIKAKPTTKPLAAVR